MHLWNSSHLAEPGFSCTFSKLWFSIFFLALGEIRCLDLIFFTFFESGVGMSVSYKGSILETFHFEKSSKHRQMQHVCNQSVMYNNILQEMAFLVCHFWQIFPNGHVWVHTRWSILEGLHVCQCLPNIGKTNTCAGSWNHAPHRFHKQWHFPFVFWFCL